MKAPGDQGFAATVASGEVGRLIADRYELITKLGEGGMGAVFRARDRELEEDVALKVLRQDLEQHEGSLARFRREVKLARRVTHPNVVRTYDLGHHDGLRFLTMELLDGESLARHAARRLALPDVLRIAADVARGLAAAHAVAVVHRDLKPDNVMVCGDRIAITDFGIARAIEDGSPGVTRGVLGTVSYMAPEQLESGGIDGRADVYAFGVMLFELLTGELPFQGPSHVAIAMARILQPAPDPRSISKSLPEGVAQLVIDAMARRREDRPFAQTILERIEQLRGVGMVMTVPGPQRALKESTTESTSSNLSLDLTTRVDTEIVVALAHEADADTAQLALDLESALLSEMAGQRHVRLVSGPSDARGYRLETTLRSNKGRVRVRLRLLRGTEAFGSATIDGTLDEPFDLEDKLVAAARTLLDQRLSRKSTTGRSNDTIERAREAFERFDPKSLREAVAALEQVLVDTPDDPHAMSLLAAAYARVWLQMGATDRTVIARAEELALRALDADPTMGEPYHALAMMRLVSGDARAALRGEQEALRRSPLLAEAHYVIGAILIDTGHVEDGMRRIEVALRLRPNLTGAHFARILTLEMLGDQTRADEAVRTATTFAGPLPLTVIEMRLAMWRRDRAYADRIADVLAANPTGAAWDVAMPFLRAFAADRVDPGTDELFVRMTSPAVGGRQRTLMHQLATEHYVLQGDHDRALQFLLGYASLQSFDLTWFDRCPVLVPLRPDPRFAEARTQVAGRVALIFGA